MAMLTRYRLFRLCGRDSFDAALDANHRALVLSLLSIIAIVVIELFLYLGVK